MKRVMIVGAPGSGKSTLARLLGEVTGLPVYHMDHIHWQAGWVERSSEEKSALTREVHARETWIFEGGHSRTYEERIARADTFIWLDMPLARRIFRVLRRSWSYRGQSRPDLPDGCPEQFGRQTWDFLKYIWTSRKSARRKLEAVFEKPPAHLTVIRLSSLAEVRRLLAEVAARNG